MVTGKSPRLLNKQTFQGLQAATSCLFKADPRNIDILPPIDSKLTALWSELKYCSIVANEAAATKTAVPTDLFLLVSTSTPYRLFHLKYEKQSLSELLRLCMLAFIKSILFTVPGRGKLMSYLYTELDSHLRLHLQACLQPNASAEHSYIVIWALFVASISIFEDFSRDWYDGAIVSVLLKLHVTDWPYCRKILCEFLWIPQIYDKAAETIFRQVYIK
jgi:hypothetical protein